MSATDAMFERRIQTSITHADDIDKSVTRRRSVPIRSAFARDLTGAGDSPMARLVGIGGRGGAVLLKLYIALIWRSSAEPFTTNIPARKWAELLALPDPRTSGARRINDSMKTLAAQNLIALERNPGDTTTVTMLHESGSGMAYTLPRGGSSAERYLQIPAELWVSGQLQRLSAPAIAMLLAVLAEQETPGGDVWWSTTRFQQRFGLSSATRARGTKDLVEAGLLRVTRTAVASTPQRTFVRDRVRSVYSVTGSALLKKKESPRTGGMTLGRFELGASRRADIKDG